MTLTICMKTKDGVVLGSDSRASSVLTSNDTVKKIFKLHDHIGIGIAGDGPLATNLFDNIKDQLNFGFGIVKFAEEFRKLSKEKFDDWFSHLTPKERPSLAILLVGYSDDQPEIYILHSQDNFVPRKSPTGFECIGVPYIAEYLLNRLYEREVILNRAELMVAFCIKETSSQDRSVGGPTQLATFSNTKSFSFISPEDISKIEKECDQLHLVHKAYFYPEDKSLGAEKPSVATKNKKS